MTGKWANFKYILEWLSETSDSTFKGVGEVHGQTGALVGGWGYALGRAGPNPLLKTSKNYRAFYDFSFNISSWKKMNVYAIFIQSEIILQIFCFFRAFTLGNKGYFPVA